MSRAANWHDEDPPAEDTLMAQLDDIAEAGSATNVEEEAAGVCGVAAPVRDQTGATIASICIGYPAVRHSNSYVARMQRHVVDAGTELTALLGAEHT